MPRTAPPSRRSTYLSAKEAISLLGIKAETLYAYVSRGQLRSVPGDSPRERLYSRHDVEILLARRRRGAGEGTGPGSPLRWGDPVLESAVTLITSDSLCYRGIPFEALPPVYESAAEFLWSGFLPPAVRWKSPKLSQAMADTIARFPRAEGDAARFLMHVTNAAGAESAEARDPRLDVILGIARDLIRLLAASLGGKSFRKALAGDTVAASLLLGHGIRPDGPRLLAANRALIAFADHELNSSTFVARITASTGADLHSCLVASLAALSGPKHGGAVADVARLVAEVDRPQRARALVVARIRAREPLHGFGHPLYPAGDPRAKHLLALAEELAPSHPLLSRIRALVEAARDIAKVEPTGDLGLLAIAAVLGLPPSASFSLFAIGRLAGWIAHVLEQRQADTLLRPRARYVGRPRQGGPRDE